VKTEIEKLEERKEKVGFEEKYNGMKGFLAKYPNLFLDKDFIQFSKDFESNHLHFLQKEGKESLSSKPFNPFLIGQRFLSLALKANIDLKKFIVEISEGIYEKLGIKPSYRFNFSGSGWYLNEKLPSQKEEQSEVKLNQLVLSTRQQLGILIQTKKLK
jgi:hypothetical protein